MNELLFMCLRPGLSPIWDAGLTQIQWNTWKASLTYLLSFGQIAYTVRAGARTCLYYESDYS